MIVASAQVVTANEIWVSQSGNDSDSGTKSKPFATIAKALTAVRPGTTLHVLPSNKPWPSDVRVAVSGTENAPIIVDGHGSVVSGRGKLPDAAWKDEGNGIFSRKLPNNAWGMENHWEGGFPLVWFAGKAGVNVGSCEQLTPGSYFLHKNRKEQRTDPLHNTLYICVSPGEKPEDVESITGESGIFVGGSHVIVRNFTTEYGGRDGYATGRNNGVVFENVEARYFMDQGTSQHGSEVTIRKAHFHRNAGGGIVDVYPECRTRYEDCLIEADTWRGGVEFHKGEFEMVNCVIRANARKALTVTKGARVTLHNCLLIGTSGGESQGVTVGDGSRLEMNNCTLIGFRTGLSSVFEGTTQVSLKDCRILRCKQAIRMNLRHEHGQAPPNLARQFTIRELAVDRSEIELNTKLQKPDSKWQVKTSRIQTEDQTVLRERFGKHIRFIDSEIDVASHHIGEWPFDRMDEFLRQP